MSIAEQLEVDRSGLADPAACAASLENHGCAIVRQVLAIDFMFMLASIMKDFYGARKDADGNVYLSHIIADAASEPTGKNILLMLFQNIAATKLLPALRTFLGASDLLFFTDGCIMRRVDAGGEGAITFHQDAGFTNEKIKGVNIWIPFDRCGVDAPTLALIAIGGSKFYYKDEHYGRFSYDGDYYLNEEPVMSDFGDCVVKPVLEVGDVCMFDLRTIHRSYVDPKMTKSRTSLELRVCALNELPDDFQYRRGVVINADNQVFFANS